MKRPPLTLRQWFGWIGILLVGLGALGVAVWGGDILRAGLDPQVPFQTYRPPPAPDYTRSSAWALRENRRPGEAAVLFIHSTTFDGGNEWNGPTTDKRASSYLDRTVLPNYAGPFDRAGAVSAPRYRQASLYTRLTLREDAREARAFAYQDVARAFDSWLTANPDGPIVLVGVEQGSDLAERLLSDRVVKDPELDRRLVAAYLMDSPIPADRFVDVPLCSRPDQHHCVLAWTSLRNGDAGSAGRLTRRALSWDKQGTLIGSAGRRFACVNPVTGSVTAPASAARESRGATNATGLEWGARPPIQARLVAAACHDGFLWRTEPDSESFGRPSAWVERRKVDPYNLFYADIEADVLTRLSAWRASRDG